MTLWQSIKTLASLLSGRRRYKTAMSQIQTAQAHIDAIHAVMAAYRKGHYEEALQACEALKEANDTERVASYFFFSGTMLMNLGRFEEAEQRLRRHLTLAIDDRRKALAYSTLGQFLTETHRYDEALECFQTSLRHWPDRGSAHRAIAEACLRQHGRVSEAVRWAQLALQEDRARMKPGDSPEAAESHIVNLAEDLATLAWAVAVSSRDRAEVDHLVDEASKLAVTAVSPAALVHCHIGHAYLALGHEARSEQHFAEAARVDPNGFRGRSAQAMLVAVKE